MTPNDDQVALTPGAQRLVEASAELQANLRSAHLGVRHWLLALVERHGPMAEAMAQGFKAAALQRSLHQQLESGDAGAPLDEETVVRKALERAQARGKPQAAERDIAAVILQADGYTLLQESLPATRSEPAQPPPAAVTAPIPSTTGTATYRPRAKHPIPTLEQFGRDLTRAALDGKLSALVGREAEIALIIETLCRTTKRNPALVGPAGVGKTAIVEGLAQRVARGVVPELLRGSRVIEIQPSTVAAGASMAGEFEKRMKAIISEASQEGLLLFIDEMHSLMGAGGRVGTDDAASLLKPALARGDLACLAATTDDEYRRYIEQDGALERRFQPIRIQELSPEQTLGVLRTRRDELGRARGVTVGDEALQWLVRFSGEFLRNRNFPDKAVDLLEQCVAHAMAHGATVVDQAAAESVAQRMVGMPVALSERLTTLRQQLGDRALLAEDDVDSLLQRIEVGARGLDLRPARPNAVVLLLGNVAAKGVALAETIAEGLFGAADRVVTIDFSRFTNPSDLTMLIGAPPGYVGYSESLPIHRVAQMPWCVVHAENLHACSVAARDLLTQALANGFLDDARGKRIYFSDTVVLLTADVALEMRRAIGIRASEEPAGSNAAEAARRNLGEELMAQVDLVCSEVPDTNSSRRRWLQDHLLSDLATRYRQEGLDLQWDTTIVDWLLAQPEKGANYRDWERLVDARLSPVLVRYLPATRGKEVSSLLVKCADGLIQVEGEKKG
jgi:ATP-dependent Clp protease ATP-binding subunit ClpC